MAPHVKSKRVTLKHKHKVEKKVRQHRREARRANRHKPEIRKIKKKDPGIPNLWPFKQEMLQQLEQKKAEDAEKKKAAQALRREAIHAARAAGVDPATAELMADAAKRQADFDKRNQRTKNMEDAARSSDDHHDPSKRAFMKEFRKVLESSDVILEVLDARDPMGCRCYEAERAIMASSGGTKRIVLVLNKVDMIPKEITDKWLAYLRNEYPTIAFRASVQEGRAKGQADLSALAASSVNTSECLGGANLLSLLKNYSRTKNLKTSIAVGVIGYPNVGKSSLINSLKRTRAVSAGATPGLTRNAQEVHLDKNIRLIDCPGIVFSSNQADALVLRNCINIEQLYDPISPVETIIKRVGETPLMVAYGVPQFDSVTEFLAFLCSLRGKLRKGGSYDVEAAAKVVLQDWNSGKIPFYTLPPKGPNRAHLSSAIVQQWSMEFDVKSVASKEQTQLNSLESESTTKGRFAKAHASQLQDEDVMKDESASGSPTAGANPNAADEDEKNSEPTFHVAKIDMPAKRILTRGPKSTRDRMEL